MSIFKGMTRNFSILVSAQMIYKVFAFFTYVLIARYIGVQGFGQFSFALSFVGLFAVALDFGLSELLIRDVAGRIREAGERYVSNILAVKLIFMVLSYFLIAIIGLATIGDRELWKMVLILGLCLALDSLTIFFRSIFRLFEKMEFEAISIISEAILKLGFVFAMIRFLGAKPVNVAVALLAVSFLVFLLTMMCSAKRFIRLSIGFDYRFIKDLLKKAIPFAFLSFFGVINFKITTVMVANITDDISTGWYSAAARLIEPILIIPVAAGVAIFPVASRIYRESGKDIPALSKKAITALFWAGFFAIVVINMFSGRIVYFVFGSEYLNSVATLRVLSISLIAFFLKFFLERFILVLRRTDVVIKSYTYGTILTITLAFLLTKNIGYIGAAIALVFSEFFIVGYNLFSIRNA